ncbi:MAG: penicillin-binding protein activator LpoB [Bacteroidia bacterium]|nr:penicillin-binding protein activator LpoB [Bacteroidia bacterium]
MKKTFFLFLAISLFIACDPTKQYMKQGNQAYLLGDMDAAANYYYNVLLLKPNMLEAKQALQQSGGMVLQNKFSAFNKYVIEKEDEKAIKQYLSCKKYYAKCQSVGVELPWVSMYDPIYEDLKNEFVSAQYDMGLEHMRANRYDQAEAVFTKISEIDSTYKDATVLRLKSILEPLYQHGQKMMELEQYKEAFRDFEKVIKLDRTYKNALNLREEALKKASVGLGVLPVQNQTRMQGFDSRLYQQLIATLVQNKNPFLKVVDRSSLESMLREQSLGMSGMIDPESAAKAGKIIGLKYVLMTAISDLVFEDNGVQSDSLVAYEAYSGQIPGTLPNSLPQTVTRFKKVKYFDQSQKRRLYYRVFYQLVSTQTAQVVASDVISEEMSDEVHYASYQGNVNALYPELPVGKNMPPKPKAFREQFNQVKRNVASREELTQEVCKKISKLIVDDLHIYIEK